MKRSLLGIPSPNPRAKASRYLSRQMADAVSFSCPGGTRNLVFEVDTVNGDMSEGFMAISAESLKWGMLEGEPLETSDVRFATVLEGKMTHFSVPPAGQRIMLTPIGQIRLPRKAVMPRVWPCLRPEFAAVVCVVVTGDHFISRVVFYSVAGLRERFEDLGGPALRDATKAARALGVEAELTGAYSLTTWVADSRVALARAEDGSMRATAVEGRTRASAAADRAETSPDGDESEPRAVLVKPTSSLVFESSTGRCFVIDVGAAVELRTPRAWAEKAGRPEGDHVVNVEDVIASAPLEDLPDIPEGVAPEAADSFLFLAIVYAGSGRRSSAVVMRRGEMLHVSLGARDEVGVSGFRSSAAAFWRKVGTLLDEDPPRFPRSVREQDGATVHLTAFSHRARQGHGPLPERLKNVEYWEALLGAGEAAKLKDGARKRPVATRRPSNDHAGSGAELEDADDTDDAGMEPGSFGAFREALPSCSNIGVALDSAMRESLGLDRTVGAARVPPSGTQVVRPAGLVDADAGVPMWGSPECCGGPAEVRQVSATSLLAWTLGRKDVPTPTPEEVPYVDSVLSSVDGVAMSAVRRSLLAAVGVEGRGPRYVASAPPVIDALPTVHSVDLDLWEVSRQVTTTQRFIYDALEGAASLFDASGSEHEPGELGSDEEGRAGYELVPPPGEQLPFASGPDDELSQVGLGDTRLEGCGSSGNADGISPSSCSGSDGTPQGSSPSSSRSAEEAGEESSASNKSQETSPEDGMSGSAGAGGRVLRWHLNAG